MPLLLRSKRLARHAFRTIVVPVDRSRLAEEAIPTALAIAERARSKVRLVLVHRELRPLLPIEPRQDHAEARLAMQKAEREYLRTLTRQLQQRMGRALSSVMLKGPVARTLARYVRDIGADTVVMTSHGHGGMRRAWLGSVADELVRTLEVPVLLLRPGEERMPAPADFSHIQVPLDGSQVAEEMLGPAVALARLWDAEIGLVQVVHSLPSADEQAVARRLETARIYLEAVAARLGDQKVRTSSRAVVGEGVAEALMDLAQAGRAGLIAMTTHGRGGVRRLVLGSVADKVVRAAEVPVLVYRPRRRGKRS